jgi:hypothetical protein
MKQTLIKAFFIGAVIFIAGSFASPALADTVTMRGYITTSGTVNAGFYFSYNIDGGAAQVTPTRSVTVNGTQELAETITIPCESAFQYKLVFWDSADPQNVFNGDYQSASTSACQTQNVASPIVTTNAATAISSTAATFQGFVNSNSGTGTNIWFEWGTSSSFGSVTPQVNVGTTNSSFYSINNSLSPNTTYYFRAAGQNAGSPVVYGATQSFTTTGTTQNQNQPIVTTNAATNISQTSAALNGFVNSNGGTNTSTWFEWGTSNSFGNTVGQTSYVTINGTVSFAVGNLSPNTTYYFRAAAQNSGTAVVYGATQSFTTTGTTQNQNQPIVTTNAATNISQTGATLNGSVNSNGGTNTVAWFEWGTSSSFGNSSVPGAFGTTNFSAFILNLTTLSPNTTYYFRVAGQNQGTAIVYGATQSFTTTGTTQNQNQPIITTNVPTSISGTSATFQGSVNSNGGTNTNVWFEWGTSSSFGNSTPQVNVGSANTTFFSVNNLLSQNTTYYYRAAGQNPGTAVVYGATQSFTTGGTTQNQNQPIVTTNSATGITQSSASLNGFVNSNGGTNTNAWFEWGTSSSFGNTTGQVNYGTTNSTYSYYLGNLSQNTTYYFRAVAQNSGTSVVYGATQSFTTTSNNNNNCGYGYNCNNTGQTPSVTTYSPVQNGDTYSILQGFVDPNGSTNTTRWFEWGVNNSYFSNTTLRLNQSSAGTFTQTVSGLNPNTTYYYRAVAQNTYGTVYGTVMTFVTGGSNYNNNTYNYVGGSAPTAVTTLATSIGQTTARVNGLVFINGGVYTNGWFEWGQTSSLGNTTSSQGIGSAPTLAISDTLTGLTSGRTYYYRAVVQNQYGTDKGDIMSFTATGGSNTSSTVVYTSPTVTTSKTTYVVTGSAGSTKTSAIMLSITSSRDNIGRGDRIIFTISYRNIKVSEDLTDVAVRVVLPGELSFVDASRGYYNLKDRTLTVDLKTLRAGESGSFTVEANVDNSIESGKVIVVSVDMVYTRQSRVQEEAIAYVLLNGDFNQSSRALAPLFGSGFFPNTLIGWLLLILIIFLLGVLSRHVVGKYRVVNVVKK